MNRVILIIAILTAFYAPGYSQSATNSPYAIFGNRTPIRDVEHNCLDSQWSAIIILPDATLARMELYDTTLFVIDSNNRVLALSNITHTTKALFTAPDPKAWKMTSSSPYSYCFGNPVLFVDPDGEEPTPYQAALMSRASYKDLSIPKGEVKSNFASALEALNIENWVLCHDFDQSIQLNHHANSGIGMQAMIFKRTTDDNTEYALAFAGTNSFEDCVVDITQTVGIIPDVGMSLNAAHQLKSQIGGAELTYVAHSLGAVLASAASMSTGDKAITFNPAVISTATKLFHGLKGNGNIVNYISTTNFFGIHVVVDPITRIQQTLGLIAPGSFKFVDVNVIFSHGIDKICEALTSNKK